MIACPSCGNTNLTFDLDTVISVAVKDGVITNVGMGGPLGARAKLLCGECETYGDPAPAPDDVDDEFQSAVDVQLVDALVTGLRDGVTFYSDRHQLEQFGFVRNLVVQVDGTR